jgi:endonuclease VIII
MPEGPEIRRAADKIAQAVVNQPLTAVFFAFDHLKPYESLFQAQTIIAVEPHGKALLTQFDGGLSIYSHNQLYGIWMVRKAQDYPKTQRQLRMAFHTEKKSALLYSASEIEVLDPEEVAAHPFLSRLGPDVVSPKTTESEVLAQVNCDRFRRRRLAGLLLDQHFLCGLGNYLRSEVAFVARVYPNKRPMDCRAEQLEALGKGAIALARQSYQTGGITNDVALAAKLKAQGWRRQDYRHWVFNRAGLPCHVCGTEIEKLILAGRRAYVCPYCQPE